METLWNLYQERLNELNSTFIMLLSEFENNQLLTTPQLAKYRIEYLESMVQKTLKNNQQKLILKLYQEIDHLRNQNQKLHQQIVQLNTTTYQNDIEFECKEKSLGSTKVSAIHRREKTQEEVDSFMESYSSKFGRGKQNPMKTSVGFRGKQKQKTLNITNKRKHGQDSQDQEELQIMNMNFKYLKL